MVKCKDLIIILRNEEKVEFSKCKLTINGDNIIIEYKEKAYWFPKDYIQHINFTPIRESNSILDLTIREIREICNFGKCSKCMFASKDGECPFYNFPYKWHNEKFDSILTGKLKKNKN